MAWTLANFCHFATLNYNVAEFASNTGLTIVSTPAPLRTEESNCLRMGQARAAKYGRTYNCGDVAVSCDGDLFCLLNGYVRFGPMLPPVAGMPSIDFLELCSTSLDVIFRLNLTRTDASHYTFNLIDNDGVTQDSDTDTFTADTWYHLEVWAYRNAIGYVIVRVGDQVVLEAINCDFGTSTGDLYVYVENQYGLTLADPADATNWYFKDLALFTDYEDEYMPDTQSWKGPLVSLVTTPTKASATPDYRYDGLSGGGNDLTGGYPSASWQYVGDNATANYATYTNGLSGAVKCAGPYDQTIAVSKSIQHSDLLGASFVHRFRTSVEANPCAAADQYAVYGMAPPSGNAVVANLVTPSETCYTMKVEDKTGGHVPLSTYPYFALGFRNASTTPGATSRLLDCWGALLCKYPLRDRVVMVDGGTVTAGQGRTVIAG